LRADELRLTIDCDIVNLTWIRIAFFGVLNPAKASAANPFKSKDFVLSDKNFSHKAATRLSPPKSKLAKVNY
jgi:hypothetical protein